MKFHLKGWIEEDGERPLLLRRRVKEPLQGFTLKESFTAKTTGMFNICRGSEWRRDPSNINSGGAAETLDPLGRAAGPGAPREQVC